MSSGAVNRRKVTDWFPANTPPVRPGVYEMFDLPYPFHYWDGAQWLDIAGVRVRDVTNRRIKSAAPMPKFVSYHLDSPWRGLAADPSKAGV